MIPTIPVLNSLPFKLLCCGDATHPATHGGLSFCLLTAGLKSGLFSGGLALHPEHLLWKRRLWNTARLLRHGKAGGFQYSKTFTQALLAQASLPFDQPLSILSHFPLLPAYPWPEAWRVAFYIDATTIQVLNDYGTGKRISLRYQQQVLERERRAYEHAIAVICRSQWAADSVIADYGINSAKVAVVPGGANLDEAALASLPPAPPPPAPSAAAPLRLGFLGKDWERKGGPFLLELAAALCAAGLPTVVRAIGPDPASLPADPRLEALGFINKQRDIDCFVAEVRSWHFGTLFSSAEAFGISNRECLRLGVPVLTHAVGGISSTLPYGGSGDDSCGHLFTAHPSVAEVANWIRVRLSPYEAYLSWRAALAQRGESFTWAAAARQLRPLLEPSQ